MLDSSPISISPPKKLKRTASAASLPSPPPSVEHLKKRTTSQRFDTDTDSGDDDEDDEATKDTKVIGRKLLFPMAPLTSSGVDDVDGPFVENNYTPPNTRDQLSLDNERSPSAHRALGPASSPSIKRKTTTTPSLSRRTPSPVDQRARCFPLELPVLDEENNPFLVDGPTKSRRSRSPCDIKEHPTMTYVFKGIKTSVPNPNYNLPDSAYDRSRLPLSHPEYSPLPTRAPRRLFPEAYRSSGDIGEESVSNDPIEPTEKDLRTPDMKPRMSKLFVDAGGNPLPDSGPQGIRGATMDARDIGRMAVGPIRGHA